MGDVLDRTQLGGMVLGGSVGKVLTWAPLEAEL